MNQERLSWKNLRSNKCPKCGDDLAEHPSTLRLACTNKQCSFSISKEAFQRIVADRNKESLEQLGYEVDEEQKDCGFCRTKHSPQEQCAGFGV